ncbi:hypothetical protein BP6252_13890 [Coleophoma cylindrospora]|uniref:F-box domain-containing protein n=1 Tax=Coleophoma cylindrospora TaxID=1849047 RepID=A0A3D8Q5F4_9HELO|nr:hypothetical protein BP6252_13890 [Coleophoma cylindrospora]
MSFFNRWILPTRTVQVSQRRQEPGDSRGSRFELQEEVPQEKDARIQSADTSVTQSLAPFRFMDLPLEIRVLIYQTLAPNVSREPDTVPQLSKDDVSLPSPAILCTSRQVYSEAINEWYGQMYFCAYISRNGWEFNGRYAVPFETPFSRPVIALKQLDLSIVLGQYIDYYDDKDYEYTEFLGRLLALGNEVRRLQKIRFRLVINRPFFEFYRDRLEALQKGLAEELFPLQHVRGFSEASLFDVKSTYLESTFVEEDGQDGFEKSLVEMKAGIQEFLLPVLHTMTLPAKSSREEEA